MVVKTAPPSSRFQSGVVDIFDICDMKITKEDMIHVSENLTVSIEQTNYRHVEDNIDGNVVDIWKETLTCGFSSEDPIIKDIGYEIHRHEFDPARDFGIYDGDYKGNGDKTPSEIKNHLEDIIKNNLLAATVLTRLPERVMTAAIFERKIDKINKLIQDFRLFPDLRNEE